MKPKPNLFMVGAAKSGTTSLYKYLTQHSEIYFSPVKEPNYFSDDIDIFKFSPIYKKNTFLKADRYFRQQELHELPLAFVRKKEHYAKLFEKSNHYKIRGEASTSYLYSKSAAENIYNYNPEAKIIVILRNPMERAFSHYLMAVRYGYTSLNFKEAVIKDWNKENKGWGISELFIELGLYHDQLKRYFNIFPKEQILVLFFDDLKTEPQKLLDQCYHFLELEAFRLDDPKAYNTKESPKNIRLNYFLTRSGLKNTLKHFLSQATKDKLSQAFYSQSKLQLGKDDFDFLLDFYQDDIQKTAGLLNKNLDHWLIYKK